MDPLKFDARGGGGDARPAYSAERVGRKGDEVRKPEKAGSDSSEGNRDRESESSALNRAVTFSVDRDTQEVIAKVVDRESGEVLREVPPEELRDALKALDEASKNLLDRFA